MIKIKIKIGSKKSTNINRFGDVRRVSKVISEFSENGLAGSKLQANIITIFSIVGAKLTASGARRRK